MTAEELADHAQAAFENNLMDDPTPYEMGRAWKAVGERLFEILAEEAESAKEDRKEIQKTLGYSRVSSSSPKY